MRYLPFSRFVAVMAVTTVSAGLNFVAVAAGEPQLVPGKPVEIRMPPKNPYPDVGKPATQEDIGNFGWTSGASGKGLPSGQGTAKDGAPIYAVKCSMCHGKDGEGIQGAPGTQSPYMGRRLFGGNSVPLWEMPPGKVATHVTTMASATATFNAIAVEMPFYRPGTLTANEVYALTALILFKNNLIKEDEVMDRQTLPKVQLPNRKAYPATDDIYMDMKLRGCWKTFGECRDP